MLITTLVQTFFLVIGYCRMNWWMVSGARMNTTGEYCTIKIVRECVEFNKFSSVIHKCLYPHTHDNRHLCTQLKNGYAISLPFFFVTAFLATFGCQESNSCRSFESWLSSVTTDNRDHVIPIELATIDAPTMKMRIYISRLQRSFIFHSERESRDEP